LLEGGEIPEIPYGQRENDRYQNTEGIARSTRKIPADIPKKQIVGSSVERLDPARQLREAGYPFSHISIELTDLHGKFEVVSKDVLLLKDTIAGEAKKLSDKVDQSQKTTLEKVESLFDTKFMDRVEILFDRKFWSAAGSIVGCILMMYGAVTFLQSHGITGSPLGWVSMIGGLAILSVVYLIVRRRPSR